jgi:hypothetical protein
MVLSVIGMRESLMPMDPGNKCRDDSGVGCDSRA